ncbi:MAG: hypothetical protein HKL95_09095 [Phycisphaerae bacterium]|nr:hypothetical protein [Phycisphaerae bacterium]
MPVHEMFVLLGKMMPAWQQTPRGTRETLIERLTYPINVISRSTVPGVEALVAGKWLDADWKKSEIRRGKACGLVWEILRVLERSGRFSDDAGIGLLLAEIFTFEQRDQLVIKGRNNQLHQRVELSVRSRAWVSGFLAAPDKATWMKQMHLQGPLHSPMEEQAVFGMVQKLVKTCLEQSHPLQVEQAANSTDFGGRETFYRLLGLAVEHLLLIPFLDPETRDLLVMIEPTAHRSLRRPPVVRPVPVEAKEETFRWPWIVEDIVVVLTQAAFKPLRMKTDGGLYTQDIAEVASAIMPLPEWLLNAQSHRADSLAYLPTSLARTDFAVGLALRSKFLGHDRDGSWRELKPTVDGQTFLSLSPCHRVRQLSDAMIASQVKEPFAPAHPFSNPFGGLQLSKEQKSPLRDLRPLIAQAVAQYPAESYIPTERFLWYHGTKDNPYIAEAGNRGIWKALCYSFGEIGTPASQPERWEDLWIYGLAVALFHRVAGMGGVTFGHDRDANAPVHFQVNAIGRYLLGLTAEFVYDQTQAVPEKPLLVQPNFEVVFVAASPTAHVLCGQFCERSGKGAVGNLLKITKKSIIRAASAGWTVERVVETLANASSKPLPANVLHEIRGWFGGVRRVQAHHCVLVTCPDAVTADRVASLYAHTEPRPRILSGHLVELSGSLNIAEITNRLHKAGIFVS